MTASKIPPIGEDGVFTLLNKEEHEAFVEANSDKLIVLKVFAPWCRACKGLQPKFLAVVQDEKYHDLPLVWAQLSVQHNKEFVQQIGVLALPTVQFYVGGSLADTFPCGPSKVPILKRKLVQLVNDHVDPKTRKVKATSIAQAKMGAITTMNNDTETSYIDTADMGTTTGGIPLTATTPTSAAVVARKSESAPRWSTTSTSTSPLISLHERIRLRKTIHHFASMSIADFDRVLDEAKLQIFEAGDVIVRQGKPGRTFFIIKEGEVEICQKTFAEDPLQSSGWYLGTVVNRLGTGDYFGERSLLTGEPRAASIRAAERTSLYALDRDSFPMSSPLSGRTRFSVTDWMEQVDDKYGVAFAGLYEREVQNQVRQANAASQTRGSVNQPNKIPGVDTDEDIDWEARRMSSPDKDASISTNLPLTDPTTSTTTTTTETNTITPQLTTNNETVFQLLRRFKMIRQVSKCMDYIALAGVQWGETGSRTRRNMLVGRLSPAEREEFSETFDILDQDKSGEITLLELKRVMESVGDPKTDQELQELINDSVRRSTTTTTTAGNNNKQQPGLSKQDFMGIMAEAEFYYLFRDIFKTLDPNDSGYVKARDLDRVLSGTRDLIFIADNPRTSIIDMRGSTGVSGNDDDDDEDLDMLIDYEQFSRMLLG